MPLLNTENELGKAMHKAATASKGDAEASWKEVASILIKHFTSNALVTGVAPSGGGPITEGKLQ